MADVSKAQKLASARKKFKELKKEKKKNAVQKVTDTVESNPSSREQTPVENVTYVQEVADQAPLPNYFSTMNHNNGYQHPAAFFDTFVHNNDNLTSHPVVPNSFSNNYFYNESAQFASHEPESTQIAQHEPQSTQIAQLEPESTPISQHEPFPNNYEINSEKTQNVDSVQEVETKIDPPVTTAEDDKISEDYTNFHVFDTVKLDQNPPQTTRLSSLESLRQLSDQMAELINPTSESTADVLESQLEIRNQELAGLLSQEKQKSEELNATLKEYQSRLMQLEAELKDRQLNTDTKIEQEVSTLREQLQCHIQTVGILVAEKTELVANLSQFQLAAKQKTVECEELQGRLKTSRSRVADLEREVALLKNEKSQYDNVGREQSSELEKLIKSNQQLKEERDELMQDVLEVREKLKSSSENNLVFQQQIGELSNQLSLANIKIQQLTVGEIDQVSGQVERLTQEKFALEKQVADLTRTVKSINKERDESSLQYQQYAQQLNSQLTNMAARLEKLQKENESLQIQEQNRIKHIGELEKQLQNLQNDQVTFAVQRSTGSESRAELDAALELVEKLKTENTELGESNIKVLNEKELLLKDLEDKAGSIRELEELVEDLKKSQPDSAKLLATMESDKVAAARAVAQNTELKRQMESMQEVFMKLNNDKIELTESLTAEQRNNKELFDKLQKTEIHLQTLADAIEIKDKELSHLRENSFELDKQVLHSEQLNDRLRHYEAQDHSTHSLQNELQESTQKIEKLTEEINRLRAVAKENLEEVKDDEKEEIPNETYEISELKRKVDHLEHTNKELEAKLSRNETTIDSNHNDQWTVLDRESAMKHLEQKFMKTMEDIANLTEEKQRLEHLVMQLQGETETIGEYVALYQHQRSLLKQKAIEKDQQLTQLSNDREHMKTKLEQLNELVKKLVLEKGAVPPELLEHHENSMKDNHLCEEHAKIHSEINKIAQTNFTIEPSNCDSGSGAETAEQIIALLSEIKSSNLIQPTENFHHCPWCSGQLITV